MSPGPLFQTFKALPGRTCCNLACVPFLIMLSPGVKSGTQKSCEVREACRHMLHHGMLWMLADTCCMYVELHVCQRHFCPASQPCLHLTVTVYVTVCLQPSFPVKMETEMIALPVCVTCAKVKLACLIEKTGVTQLGIACSAELQKLHKN